MCGGKDHSHPGGQESGGEKERSDDISALGKRDQPGNCQVEGDDGSNRKRVKASAGNESEKHECQHGDISRSGQDVAMDRRRRLQMVARDQSLSPATKMKELQKIYSEDITKFKNVVNCGEDEAAGAVRSEEGSSDKFDVSSILLRPDRKYGCKHYERKCMLVPKCCNGDEKGKPVYYVCRLCHDESEEHTIDRYATEEIVCLKCGTRQCVGKNCVSCDVEFAKYFCESCKFFDDGDKQIYHCKFCKLCRLGSEEANKHCHKCGHCFARKSFDTHVCRAGALDAHCPICTEYLFTSIEKVIFLSRCGHSLHQKCFEDYIKRDYRCPLCFKSVADMKTVFDKLDVIARQEEVAPSMAGKEAEISCNDCNKRSCVPLRHQFMKCKWCPSYNTRLIREVEYASPIGRETASSPIH